MAVRRLRVKVEERWYEVEVEDLSASPVKVTVDGETFLIEVEGLPGAGRQARPPTPSAPVAAREGRPPPSPTRPPVSEKLLLSPMPGRVMAVSVRPGDRVSPGDEVCVIEAMKMEQSIRVSQEGVIKGVHIRPAQQVNAGDLLVELA